MTDEMEWLAVTVDPVTTIMCARLSVADRACGCGDIDRRRCPQANSAGDSSSCHSPRPDLVSPLERGRAT
jgi:hypothetical protein